jgi:hypothetical protein
LIRRSERTRARSSACSNGFATKSSAPASIALRRSCAPLAVIITIGRKAVAGSSRSARQTAYPSIPGITMSSSTRSTAVPARRSSASGPDGAERTA